VRRAGAMTLEAAADTIEEWCKRRLGD